MNETIIRTTVEILDQIPNHCWNEFMKNDPVWVHLEKFHKGYGFGRFSVLLIMSALNAYQLKGKAELRYWPTLSEYVSKYDTPKNPDDLKMILINFYKNERIPTGKIKRVETFLSSSLAKKIWKSSPEDVERDFQRIWFDLSDTMHQRKNAKTICFAMKCLGMSLYIHQKSKFEFSCIPIPVDSRINNVTRTVLGNSEITQHDIQQFWNHVLKQLQIKKPYISMIHLDSVLWQIGTLSDKEFEQYCHQKRLTHIENDLKIILKH